jgi:hypothetical protein
MLTNVAKIFIFESKTYAGQIIIKKTNVYIISMKKENKQKRNTIVNRNHQIIVKAEVKLF